MRVAAAATLFACALATVASSREKTARAPAVQNLGRLAVSVESVSRPTARSPELTVTLRASAFARNERTRVAGAALVDVRGRRFEARRDGSPEEIRPGIATFRFDVPADAGIVTFEINGRSFEVAHVNRLVDTPNLE